jgi:subtilase family serine protease
MSDAPGSPAGQEANEATLARHLLELQQTLDRYSKEDNRLEAQQFQLQSQIAQYVDYARHAQATNQENLWRHAQARLAELYPYLNRVQQQRAYLKAQIDTLAQQQQWLLSQLGAYRASQQGAPYYPQGNPPWGAPPYAAQNDAQPNQKRARGPLIIGFSILTLILIAAILLSGIARRPFAQNGNQTTNAPTSIPRSTPITNPFAPNGTGPSNKQCVNDYGQPCYNPEDIQKAFSLTPLYQQGYDGGGSTIVLIDAGNTDQVQANLTQFDQAMGLPDPNLTIVQPFGPPAAYTCPDGEDDLQGETILDVEWSHAIAPGAKIVVLIGSNDSGQSSQNNCFLYGLEQSVSYAVDHRLGQIVSLSYGGSELGDVHDTAADKQSEQQEFAQGDNLFKQAAREGITVIDATGDTGVTNGNDYTKGDSFWTTPNVNYPASDPNVLAVGGTKLTINSQTSDYVSETVWNDQVGATGGGLSTVYSEPDYQKNIPNQSVLQGKRGIPDVSFPADNFLVYDTTINKPFFQDKPEWAHWAVVGGTSASAPCWAGLIAIANQLHGKPLGLVQPALYSLNGKDMHDITSGNNSFANIQGYQAVTGFDLASGWGTPIASTFLPALAKAANQS